MSDPQLNSRQLLSKSFSPITKDKALNCISYGLAVNYGSDKKKFIAYQNEVDPELLMLLPYNQAVPSKLDFIDLTQVIDIQELSPFEKTLNTQWLMLELKNKKHYFSFNDQEEKNLLWQAILNIIKSANVSKQQNMKADYVKQMALDFFSKADQDLSDNLTYEECLNLIQKLNVNISKKDLLEKFQFYDENNDKLLQVNEFVEIIRDLLSKSELMPLFKKYVPSFNEKSNLNSPAMKKETFFKFMKAEQKQEEIDLKSQQFLDMYFAEKNNIISYNDFINLIFNYQNNIYDPAKLSVYQDMDQPLTDYFINSSHNTYLMANQLTGESNVQAYINAFRKGCRCIEIDVWDGSEPIVTHGFTLTSSIKFRDVVQTIKTYGFVWSKYPIIISIENHCNQENQKKMANIMKEIFGSSIYLIPENYSSMKFYPSPRQLKKKIIIKAKGTLSQILEESVQTVDLQLKKQSKSTPHQSRRIRDSVLFSNIHQQDQIDLNQIYHFNIEKAFSQNDVDDNTNMLYYSPMQLLQISESNRQFKSIQYDQEDTERTIMDSDDETDSKSQVAQVKDFQRCISMVGVSFTMDMIKFQNGSIFDIFSLSEEKIKYLLKKHEKIIVDYHKKFFSRIYPKGSRVDSSNFDPLPSFISGSQIIALNFQTCDYHMLMYLSKFQQNGGIFSGYVLKPKYLRHSHIQQINSDDHKLCDDLNKNKNTLQKYPSDFVKQIKEIKITIISGQCLKREEDDSKSFNPFIEVSLKGTELDEKNNKTQRTKSINNNTFHPIFNSSPITFKVACPELAMISFQVFSNGIIKNELFAQYALDFECIREGYRIIPLWDKEFKKIEHGMLLAHIEILDLYT
ncbi:phosphatidylinositol-specific phospholipase C, X domain protein (macronuclear) [Tetrahymena thermophila SB210]|uniref:Phosphoinositide phospholipase C n=1 Tax=Tetrahymena thermophila (strain SB210) TaxID=312017 RepID=I7MMC1_TETTS|nr:phosphatidylinositol-specific phospholipase C, X domain protein [Tetrahymena thermophila SB210]EAS04565.1 phosphatidylinositol-specific phospholipase C, X domain protein [Tetrahymena thermophila SB210]|eukprot:XP_001024810.1 phosphatidylinositol-specific phospholipase C, X domain protein [Tetrahymena thermophila SB210]